MKDTQKNVNDIDALLKESEKEEKRKAKRMLLAGILFMLLAFVCAVFSFVLHKPKALTGAAALLFSSTATIFSVWDEV